MRILYGPIDSWRFGRSMGVDPLAQRIKLCPFSCVYCQYGPTERPHWRRKTYVTPGQLRADVEALPDLDIDCWTFAGLGEPTLAANLGALAAALKTLRHEPISLLTGSGLMPQEDVRRDLMLFDQVAVQLDAPDEETFRRIHRPGSGYPYPVAAIVDGIRRFRQSYRGRFVLQVMLVQANLRVVERLAALARSLNPDQVFLNTPLQPALGGPVTAVEMAQAAEVFHALPVRAVFDGGRTRITPRLM